jgi:hypothetical protein
MSFIKDRAPERPEGPPCNCGKANPGILSGKPVGEEVDGQKVEMVMHFTDACLTTEIDRRWWQLFAQHFMGSIQRERAELAQQLACVVNASGGQVRFNVKEEMERSATHKFRVVIEPPDEEGFITIKSPASRLVLASGMPPKPRLV